MPKRDGPRGDDGTGLAGFGRYAGPATLILSSLADGPKHGYALTKDVESFAGAPEDFSRPPQGEAEEREELE